MNDNEIKKALECCSVFGLCHKCPYANTHNCANQSAKDTLDLINRQRAEIERLEIELKAMRGAANSYKAEVERLGSLAEELVDGNEAWVSDNCELRKKLKTAKSEAIRDFAESVKMAFYYEFDEIIPSIMADRIDNLVKEMTEGTE
jgi:hypothetical protein